MWRKENWFGLGHRNQTPLVWVTPNIGKCTTMCGEAIGDDRDREDQQRDHGAWGDEDTNTTVNTDAHMQVY